MVHAYIGVKVVNETRSEKRVLRRVLDGSSVRSGITQEGHPERWVPSEHWTGLPATIGHGSLRILEHFSCESCRWCESSTSTTLTFAYYRYTDGVPPTTIRRGVLWRELRIGIMLHVGALPSRWLV